MFIRGKSLSVSLSCVFRYDVFIDRDETSSFQAMHGHYRESVKLWQSLSNKIGPRNEITDHPIDPLS